MTRALTRFLCLLALLAVALYGAAAGAMVARGPAMEMVICSEGGIATVLLDAKGDPVANADLWRSLIPLATERPMLVEFQWVKAHCGIELNEAADRLATAGVPGGRAR